MYFPGPSSAAPGRPGGGASNGAALDRALPRATLKGPTHVPPRAVPAADPRMRSLGPNFSGSLERELSNLRPDTGGDPASPMHRDAAAPGSRGNTSAGRSPYGNLVPRQSGQRAPKGYGNARGTMQRPSQQMVQTMNIPPRAQQQRIRPNGPRTRFPQNFPTQQNYPSRSGGGGYGAGFGKYDYQPDPMKLIADAGAPLPAGAGTGRGMQWAPPASGAGVLTGGAASHAPAYGGGYGGGGGLEPSGGADDELNAAMAELSNLQGLATGDARDSWRFEQAARPSTAAPAVQARAIASSGGRGAGGASGEASGSSGVAGSRGGVAQVMSVGGPSDAGDEAVLMRPTTAALDSESESELRLRLATAESVMRKLYRKTNDLQERLTTVSAAPPHGAPASPGGGGGGSSESGAAAVAGPSSPGGDVTQSEREQALYLLQQKEADLQSMREYTSQLAARLEHLTAEQQRAMVARPQTAAAGGEGGYGGPRNDEYRERYMRMRGEYRNLLRSRTDSVRRSGRLSVEKESNVLIEQLDTALKDEADLHRKESQRLNEELYLQEKKSCDWYVERRLLQDRLQALESEIGQRDQLEGQIDDKMLALFGRLKALEDQNLRLEQTNESLRQKAGVEGDE